MIGGGWPCPFFSYTLAFTLQLRKSTHNLSQGSQLVLHTGHCADFAAFFGVTWTGLLSTIPRQLPMGDFSQPFVGTSAFIVAELRGTSHQ
jgi:hypothetical protein